jgi:hypothetical protein
MAQRVLAENAGVESVRYELPNKHYIPVDMKYIGVDNTTPYVPETFSCVQFFGTLMNCFPGLFHFWKTSFASCCGAEVRRGGSFPRSDAVPPMLIYYAVRAWSTDAYPFLFSFSDSRQNAEVFTPVDAPR